MFIALKTKYLNLKVKGEVNHGLDIVDLYNDMMFLCRKQ